MFLGTRNKSSRARQGCFRRTIHLLTERVPDQDLRDLVGHKPTTCIDGTTEIHPESKAGWRVGWSSSLIVTAYSYYLHSRLTIRCPRRDQPLFSSIRFQSFRVPIRSTVS